MKIDNSSLNILFALGVSLIFMIYSPIIESELPDLCRYIFSNSFVIFLCLLLMIYIGNKNILLVLIIMIILCFITTMINKYDTKDFLSQKINSNFNENFINYKETFINNDSLDDYSTNTGKINNDSGLNMEEENTNSLNSDLPKNFEDDLDDSKEHTQSKSHSDSFSKKRKGKKHTHTHSHTHHG